MNLDIFKKLVDAVQKKADNSDIPTDYLVAKLSKHAMNNPNDMTLRMLSNVLTDMSKRGDKFITKAQLNSLYDKFYVKNTVANQVLASDLSIKDDSPIERKATLYQAPKQDKTVLANVFASFIDKDHTPVFYDNKTAESAKQLLIDHIQSVGLSATASVVNGNLDVILCVASVETPNGRTEFFVPMNVVKGIVTAPSQFITDHGTVDIKNMAAYVVQNQGKQVKTAGNVVYSSLIRKQASDNLSSVDFALAKKRLFDKEISDANDLRIKIEASAPETKEQKHISVDQYVFSKKLATENGKAELKFGPKTLATCSTAIENRLKSMHVKASSIEVSNTTKDTINFAVKVATASFFVPVKLDGEKVFSPGVLINNGNVMSFTRENVNSLIQSSQVDSKAILAIASNNTLSVNDLMQEFKKSLASNNLHRAEEVLTYIHAKNKQAHKEAVTLLMNQLSGKTAVASGCKSYYISKHSSYPICTHTGLTMDKVTQDELGDCIAITSKKYK